MAGIKISGLPAITACQLTDLIPEVQPATGGVTYKATLQQVATLLGYSGGILSLANGGTNAALTASNGGIVWSNATQLQILAGTATANQILLSGATASPAWSTTTYPATNAINTIMYASSANVLGVITPVNSATLVTSAGGVPSFSQTLPGAVQSNITQLGAQSQALNMNSHLINNVTDPVNSQDAATKNYVDTIATGGAAPVYAASTTNLTGYTYLNGVSGVGATLTAGSSGVFTVDGTTPPVGSRFLYKNDTTYSGAANGIYTLTVSNAGLPAILTRAIDYDTVSDINDTGLIPVINGTANANTGWYNTTTMVTVGTTALTFILLNSFPSQISVNSSAPSASLVINSSGYVTTPNNPSFNSSVTSTSSGVTGDGTAYTIIGWSNAYDVTSSFNTTTGTFTAPVTGVYYFSALIMLGGVGAGNTAGQGYFLSGALAGGSSYFDTSNWGVRRSGSQLLLTGSLVIFMNANTTLKLVVVESANGSKNITLIGGVGNTTFSGCLVG